MRETRLCFFDGQRRASDPELCTRYREWTADIGKALFLWRKFRLSARLLRPDLRLIDREGGAFGLLLLDIGSRLLNLDQLMLGLDDMVRSLGAVTVRLLDGALALGHLDIGFFPDIGFVRDLILDPWYVPLSGNRHTRELPTIILDAQTVFSEIDSQVSELLTGHPHRFGHVMPFDGRLGATVSGLDSLLGKLAKRVLDGPQRDGAQTTNNGAAGAAQRHAEASADAASAAAKQCPGAGCSAALGSNIYTPNDGGPAADAGGAGGHDGGERIVEQHRRPPHSRSQA